MTAILDVLAGLSIANSNMNPSTFMNQGTSLTIAATETKQGMYREYTVDNDDKKVLDDFRSTYKTAEETDENKTKVYNT
jgi:hypothetical protein